MFRFGFFQDKFNNFQITTKISMRIRMSNWNKNDGLVEWFSAIELFNVRINILERLLNSEKLVTDDIKEKLWRHNETCGRTDKNIYEINLMEGIKLFTEIYYDQVMWEEWNQLIRYYFTISLMLLLMFLVRYYWLLYATLDHICTTAYFQ